MNTMRVLKVVAGVQAIAIAVLLVLWLQQVPSAAPVAAAPAARANGAEPLPADAKVPAAAPKDAASPSASAPTPPVTDAATSAVLYGSARCSDGQTRSGYMWLYRGGESVDNASVGKDPTFAFAGLAPGRYTIKGKVNDCLPFEQEFDVVAPQTRAQLTFTVAWTLVVHAVTPDDKPLLAAMPESVAGNLYRSLTAMALRDMPTRDLPLTDLSQAGGGVGTFRGNERFSRDPGEKALPKTAIGVLALPADKPLYVALLLRTALLGAQAVTPGQTDVKFTLRPEDVVPRLATVRMHIVDGDGKPIPKLRVALNDLQSGGGGSETDSEGRVVCANLMPGRLRLGGWNSTLALPPLLVEVASGAQLDLGDVQALPSAKVKVAIEGAKRDKTNVYGMMLDPPTIPNTRATNQSYGVAESEVELAVYPGRYRFTTRDADTFASVEFDTRTVGSETVRLQLRPAPRLTLKCQAGEQIYQLTLRDPQGLITSTRTLTGTWELAYAMAPGTYTAEVTDLAGNVTKKSVTLGAGGATLIVP
jgi:hypothetical protein